MKTAYNEIDRICDMKRVKGDVKYYVQYKNSDHEWVPIGPVKRDYPQKVIAFYENVITWENGH